MKCKFSRDAIGSLLIEPLSQEWQDKIKLHLKYWGEEWDGFVYIQSHDAVEEAMDEFLIGDEQDDVDNGWSVTAEIDSWTFLQGYIGYDAGDDPMWNRKYCVRTYGSYKDDGRPDTWMRDNVMHTITTMDDAAIFDNEKNPITFWVYTLLPTERIQDVPGVVDVIKCEDSNGQENEAH